MKQTIIAIIILLILLVTGINFTAATIEKNNIFYKKEIELFSDCLDALNVYFLFEEGYTSQEILEFYNSTNTEINLDNILENCEYLLQKNEKK